MGKLTVRLERRSSDTLSPELADELLSQLEQNEHLKARFLVAEADDDNPMETICSLLGHMKPFIRVLGTASTV